MIYEKILEFIPKHVKSSLIIFLILLILAYFGLILVERRTAPGGTIKYLFGLIEYTKDSGELETLRHKLKNQEEIAKAKDGEVMSLREVIRAKDGEVSGLKGVNTAKDGTIDNLRDSIRGKDSEISSLRAESRALKDLEKANEGLQEQIKQLHRKQIQEEIGKLQKERDPLIKSREGVFNKIAELERDIAKYEAKSAPVEELVRGSSALGAPEAILRH